MLFCKIIFAVFEAVSFALTSAWTAAVAVAAVVAFVATFDVNELMFVCKVVSAAVALITSSEIEVVLLSINCDVC